MTADNGRELALIDRARKALAEAKTLGEVIEIRDQANALKHYAAKKNGAEEAARYANELRIRAERRIGEITMAMEKATGGAPYQSQRATSTEPPVRPKQDRLAEHGIAKSDVSKFEMLATVPETTFEAEVVKPEASTAAIVKLAPRRREYLKAKKRTLPQGEDPRADWCEEVAKSAQAESRRIRNDPFNKGILEIGRRASVLAKAIRSAAKEKGS